MKTSSSFKAIHFGIHTTISRIEDLRVAKRNKYIQIILLIYY